MTPIRVPDCKGEEELNSVHVDLLLSDSEFDPHIILFQGELIARAFQALKAIDLLYGSNGDVAFVPDGNFLPLRGGFRVGIWGREG